MPEVAGVSKSIAVSAKADLEVAMRAMPTRVLSIALPVTKLAAVLVAMLATEVLRFASTVG